MKITIATGKTYVVIDTDSETIEVRKIPQWGGGSGREKSRPECSVGRGSKHSGVEAEKMTPYKASEWKHTFIDGEFPNPDDIKLGGWGKHAGAKSEKVTSETRFSGGGGGSKDQQSGVGASGRCGIVDDEPIIINDIMKPNPLIYDGLTNQDGSRGIQKKKRVICPHCERKFEKKHFKQIYCGIECAKEVNRLRSSMPKKAKDEKPKKHTVKESEINQLFRKS